MLEKVDKSGSKRFSAMLVVKRSVGVTSEVNQKCPVHIGDEARTQGIHPGFETQGRHHQKSKTGVPVTLQKDSCQPNTFLKMKINYPPISVTILCLILCRKVDFTESLLSSFDIGSKNLLSFSLQSYNLAVSVLLNGTKWHTKRFNLHYLLQLMGQDPFHTMDLQPSEFTIYLSPK